MSFLWMFAEWISDTIVNKAGSLGSCMNSVYFIINLLGARITHSWGWLVRRAQQARTCCLLQAPATCNFTSSATIRLLCFGELNDVYFGGLQLKTRELHDKKSLGMLVLFLWLCLRQFYMFHAVCNAGIRKLKVQICKSCKNMFKPTTLSILTGSLTTQQLDVANI